jgi:hypothetical protein
VIWSVNLVEWTDVITKGLGTLFTIGAAVWVLFQYIGTTRVRAAEMLLKIEEEFRAVFPTYEAIEIPTTYERIIKPILEAERQQTMTDQQVAKLAQIDRCLRFLYLCSVLNDTLGVDRAVRVRNGVIRAAYYHYIAILLPKNRTLRPELHDFTTSYYPRLTRWVHEHADQLEAQPRAHDTSINRYRFITRWRFEATQEEVFTLLDEPLEFAQWWPAVWLRAEQENAADPTTGIGRRVRFVSKGWLPYTLRWTARTVTRTVPHSLTIEVTGDVEGAGRWTLRRDGRFVDVTYLWTIHANKPLVRYLSFLFRPVFASNHRWAMATGEKSLRLELARRRARSDEERSRIAAPPRPMTFF